MIPLTSEKVHGVYDGATYSATLCMARDGRHYFFTAISVDSVAVNAPNKRWGSRRAAMQALAEIASANQQPYQPDADTEQPQQPQALVKGDDAFLKPED